jgi:hypothetical protein
MQTGKLSRDSAEIECQDLRVAWLAALGKLQEAKDTVDHVKAKQVREGEEPPSLTDAEAIKLRDDAKQEVDKAYAEWQECLEDLRGA